MAAFRSVDHVAVVQESVEDGGGEDAIAEHAPSTGTGSSYFSSNPVAPRRACHFGVAPDLRGASAASRGGQPNCSRSAAKAQTLSALCALQ